MTIHQDEVIKPDALIPEGSRFNLERSVEREFIMQDIDFTVIWSDYCSCIIDIHHIHVAQKILTSPIRLVGIFLNHTDVVNADNAGAFICEVLWNQELVLESVIQLIFLGLKVIVILLFKSYTLKSAIFIID